MITGRAWSPFGRVTAGALVGLSRGVLPLILLAVLRADDPPVTPDVLFRTFAQFVALPAVAAWLLGRAATATVTVRDATLCVRRPGLTLEVPCASIAQVSPWAVPLPGPGLALRLASGARLRWGLALDDPQPLLEDLERAGVVAAGAATAHPLMVWAHARAAGRGTWLAHPVVKFVLFALVPAGIFFRAHQWIAYGGDFGQYYLEGLRPYLWTFAVHWVTVAIDLVLYAAVWRALGEGVALVTAAVAPSHAARVRQAVEIVCLVAFYAGVPALVALRFLA